MKIKVVTDSDYSGNCYFIYLNKKCVIVDPCIPIDIIESNINRYELDSVILTHGHYDHVKELNELLNKYNVKIYAHTSIKTLLENPVYNYSEMFGNPHSFNLSDENFNYVSDEEEVIIDNEVFKFIYTPGHTACSISIVVGDYMFTGDMLFMDSFGRYDLPTGSFKELRNSLRKLALLEKDYLIYPGHGPSSYLKEEINKYVK